jgi:hypothetical protein
MNPASTSHGAVPSTTMTAGRASAASASPRVRGPGAMSALPSRRPAAAATTMHDSSMIPCAAMNSTRSTPLPASIAPPAIAPRIAPL